MGITSKKINLSLVASAVVLAPFTFEENSAVANSGDYTTKEELITYVNELYDLIEDKEKITNFKQLLDKQDISKYANNMIEDTATPEAREVITGMIELFLNINAANFEQQINLFETNYQNIIQAAFQGKVNKEQLLAFIAATEGEAFDRATILNETNSSSDLFKEAIAAMKTVGNSEDSPQEFKDIYSVLSKEMKSTIVVEDEMKKLFYSDENLTLAYLLAKEEVIKAAKKHAFQEDSGGTGGTGGTGDTGAENSEGTEEIDVTDISTNLTSVLDKISQATNLTTLKLNAKGKDTEASIPTEIFTALSSKNKDAKVLLSNEAGSYSLPVVEVNIAELAKQLGVNATDVKIKVVIKETTDTSNALGTLKAVAPILEFEVVATGSGKSVSIVQGKFSKHVERTIVASTELNAEIATAVRLNEDGTLTAIPTIVDGKTVTLKSLTNSKYTVISEAKTFADVDGGKNWAEEHVEKLASKLIIKGKSATKYAPKDDMTRAEFAALLSRSLGLVASADAKIFADVPANLSTNANKEIDAAAEAGLIKGYEDGKFRPNGKVTRVEAAIMMSRAIEYLEVEAEKVNTKTLAYKDTKDLPTEYVASVKAMHEAGIMTGFSDTKFGPRDYTKRDQMAKMLDQFLQSVKFGN